MDIDQKVTKGFKMVVLDMDGTALNSDHELTSKTIDTLGRLSSLGVKIAFATGRSSISVYSYMEILSLTQSHVPVICFNGSVCNTIDKLGQSNELFSYPLLKESAAELVAFAESRGEVLQYYDGVSGIVYAAPKTEEHLVLLDRYAKLTGRKQTFIESYDDLLVTLNPAKILILTNKADDLVAASKTELPQGKYHIIRGSPDPFFVEYLKPFVNKGASLVSLAEHLSIPLDQIIAFGDGDNDIEMLTCGCFGVAMANGRHNVRDVAQAVTTFTNNEDGVAWFLEELDRAHKLEYSSS